MDAFDTAWMPIAVQPAAAAMVRGAADAGGLVLLGEIHGVEQNPLIVASLMRTFELRVLGLEWSVGLQDTVDAFIEGGALDTGPSVWSNDGRITAGHFAVLRSLRRQGVLERLVLFDPFWSASWNDRDRQMAETLLARLGPGPALVMAGNMHTRLRPHRHGVPMGVHVAAARPATLEIRIRYLSGEFFNLSRKRILSPSLPRWRGAGCELRVSGDQLEVTAPVARPAVVPDSTMQEELRGRTGAVGPDLTGIKTLAAHRMGDFEVRVIGMPPGLPTRLPRLAPLQAGDPVPWLPAGMTAGRLEHGFGAAADQGAEPSIVWRPAETTIIVGWREGDGPAPEPEVLATAGGSAISWQGAAGWTLVAISRPHGRRSTVLGNRPREELLRVAESLPGQ